MPDLTPDPVDSAFERLTSDVAARTTQPGAAGAIKRAKSRRATLGVAAAVALVAVGGVVISQFGPGEASRPSPTSNGPGVTEVATLPAQAPLDVASLDAVAKIWGGTWEPWSEQELTSEIGTELIADPECSALAQTAPESINEPARMGMQIFESGPKTVAFGVFVDYETDAASADAAEAEIVDTSAACADEPPRVTSLEAGARTHDVAVRGAGGQVIYSVVGRVGNRMGTLIFAGTPRAPSQDAWDALDRALLAAVQADSSYELLATDDASASADPLPLDPDEALVTPSDLQVGFGEWDSGWDRDGEFAYTKGLPCVSPDAFDAPGSSTGRAMGTMIGNAANSMYGYETEAQASAAMEQLKAGLWTCNSARWEVTDLKGDAVVEGAFMAQFTDPAPGRDGTMWIAQLGKRLSILELDTANNPPAEVNEMVVVMLGTKLLMTDAEALKDLD